MANPGTNRYTAGLRVIVWIVGLCMVLPGGNQVNAMGFGPMEFSGRLR